MEKGGRGVGVRDFFINISSQPEEDLRGWILGRSKVGRFILDIFVKKERIFNCMLFPVQTL